MNFDWVRWTTDGITAAVNEALSGKRAMLDAVKAVPASERTFENTIGAMERSGDGIADVQQALELLVNVHPDASVRDAAQAAVDRITSEVVAMEFDRDLWRAVQEWLATGERERLTGPDRKLADDRIRDMKRMGFALDDAKFAKLKELTERREKLQLDFEKAINDWDDHIELPRERLAGLPPRYIDGLRRTAGGAYIISLQYPDLFPFMELADDDAARRELAEKNLKKGGEANMERLAELIRVRQEIAALLGYATHAQFAEEVRMSKTADGVRAFLGRIIRALEPAARRELSALVAYKYHTSGAELPSAIGFHEIGYWAHRLKKEQFGFDPEILKEYFPLARVMEGMLGMYQELFGLTFTADATIPVWHPDASAYRVNDAATGGQLGYFFLDLHPREGKYGHAATFPVSVGVQPVLALVCNFPKPTQQNPSLLSHDEVETLLHEFGHCIHALVSGGRWQRQNGFGVPLDFIEALSQICEYWAWDERSLARLSGHYRTGEPIPKELIAKVIAAKRFRQPSYFLAQAVRALYDLQMHDQPTAAPVEPSHLAAMYRDMRLQFEAIDLPDDSIFAAGWSHLADYDAGYYGYLWSRVYAADLFTQFAANPLDYAVGMRFRREVLSPGASRPEQDLVRAFLGREHSEKPFLAELGIQ